MNFRPAVMLVLIMLCLPFVAAQDVIATKNGVSIRAYSGEQIYQPSGLNPVVIETHIDGTSFAAADTNKQDASSVTYATGEKDYLIFPDPEVQQEYQVYENGSSEETLYLKSRHDITWNVELIGGDVLQMQDNGDVKVSSPNVDEKMYGYTVIEAPSGTDANGVHISYTYELTDDHTLTLIDPEGHLNDNHDPIAYPVVVDPIIDHRYELVLLLHGNSEPTAYSVSDYRDSSRYFQMPVLTQGSVFVNTTQKLYGNASLYINNTAAPSYLNISDSSIYTFGTNNFSVFGSVYYPGGVVQPLNLYFHKDTASANYDNLAISGASQVVWQSYRASASILNVPATVPAFVAGKWYTVGVIMNASSAQMYVNGTAYGSPVARGSSLTDIAGNVSIGAVNVGTYGAYHIDEVSVFNGGFAPTIDQFNTEYPLYLNASANGSNMGYADDNNTVALLHFDGVNNGVNFTDQVGNRTWTAGGSLAQTQTSQYKFSPTSGYFNGSGYVTTPYSSQFDFESNNFTIDAWVYPVYPSDGLYQGIFDTLSSGSGGANGYELTTMNTGQVGFYSNASGSIICYAVTPASSLPFGQWSHIAVVRNGNALRTYINGQNLGSQDVTGLKFNSSGHIGQIAGAFTDIAGTWTYHGYIDELRVTKGLARWTSNFVPPTYAYELIQQGNPTASPAALPGVGTVTFTDNTPDSAWTNDTFLWTFGDGTNSTLQNPSHAYGSTGIFTVIENVLNNNMTASATIMNYQVGAPVVDFLGTPTSGTAAMLVVFTDFTHNATPITSYNISFGDGQFSSLPGPWTHVYASFGNYDVNLTETNSIGTGYNLKRNYIITATSQQQQTTFYVPQMVRYKLYDFYTDPLDNINVSVCPLNFTAPKNWTNLLIGIKDSVNITGTCMQGYSGNDGSIAFPMLAAIQYQMTVSGTTADGRIVPSFTFTTYPNQPEFAFLIPTNTNAGPIMTNAPTNAISYTIYNKTYSGTQEWYNASYTDPTGGTDRIQFFMRDYTGNITYTTTISGAGANTATFSNITANPNGGSVSCGFIAHQSVIGNVSSVYVNSFPNYLTLSGGSAPGWPEMWLALIIIFAVGAFFSYTSVPIGGLVVIGMTVFFNYVIHWIQAPVGEPAFGTMLAALAVLCGLLLLRKKEDLLS